MEFTLASTIARARSEWPDDRRRAATTLGLAVAGGALTEALFWRARMGLNFFVWDLALLGATALALGRGKLTASAWGALGASALLGFAVVLRASAWSLVIAVPSTLALLGVVPALVSRPYALFELPFLPRRALGAVRHVPGAVGVVARLPAAACGGSAVARGIARGLLLGSPITLVFALLLLSDTDFARWLTRVRESLGDVGDFAAWSGVVAVFYAVGYVAHRRRALEAEDVVTSPCAPYRATVTWTEPVAEPGAAEPRVSVTTWATVLGQVALVFALFVAANLRHLFGGTSLVRGAADWTYATYLHAGFAELLLATVLSVCLVLVGHRLLRPRGDAGLVGSVPGGRLLIAFEGALLALTSLTLVSCWQRLRIYEDAYGASHLRLGVAFVEAGVLGVLLLTVAKVVRREWRGHTGATMTLGVALLVVASSFDADGYVARANLDRAAAGKALDVPYLLLLSRDAAPVLAHPFVRAHADLAARLAEAYCAPRSGDARSVRGLRACPVDAP